MNREGDIETLNSINSFPSKKVDMICVEKHTEVVNQKNTNITSGKMYINPKFLQNNFHTSVHSNSIQSMNLVTVKPSVHVNPKLYAQIMKTNSLKETSSCGHMAVDENLTDRQIHNEDLLKHFKVDGNSIVNSSKYLYCSKTKLIKQNTQHIGTNAKKQSESSIKLVPKKSSPVCSPTGPLMTLSKTKLVRAPIKSRRNSCQSSKNLLNNLSSTKKPLKLNVGRRPSLNSVMFRVSNTKLVRVPLKQRKNNVQEILHNSNDTSHTSSSMPLISLSKTKLVRSPVKQRKSSLSNKLSKRTLQSSSRTKFASKQFEPRSVISVSRTKLIRSPVKPRRTSNSENSMARQRESSKSCVYTAMIPSRVRRSSVKTPNVVIKAAKAVRSKYKIIRSPLLRNSLSYSTNRSLVTRQTRYKIDRRLHKTLKTSKCFKKYSLQFDDKEKSKHHSYKKPKYLLSPLKFWNRTWRKTLCPRKIMVTDKKLMRIGRSPVFGNKKEKRNIQQNLCLVQIGGVLYKTSKMKLTRSHTSKCKSQDVSQQDQSLKRHKMSSSLIVSVRGNKFLMDSTGKRLVKVSQKQALSDCKNQTPVKRIDIGGVTFIQKSKNVLIRTNTHAARTFVSQAKQKSIAMLTNKLKKSNQPCIFYHRFGKCTRKENGTCPYIHDPKQIAICRKFLQGCCEMNCTLSHDVGPEKMPTCKYFLEGCCVRENCPYLHVKVNEKAAICEKFLQGYCPDGKKCRKRHSFLCPEFDRTGKCSKGKYCPYRHQTVAKKKIIPVSKKCVVSVKKEHKVPEQTERKRYYETDKPTSIEQKREENVGENSPVNIGSDLEAKRLKLLKKVNDMKRAWLRAQSGGEGDLQTNSDEKAECTYKPEMKRPKIGTLPSYIPLTSDLQ